VRGPVPEPVRLRGHHLLCVLTFVGKGYSPAFVASMAATVDRIAAGAEIVLVEGPDDICAAHMAEDRDPHCLQADAAARDRVALADAATVLHRQLAVGGRLVLQPDDVNAMRTAFSDGTTRAACGGCSWATVCTGIAARGFAEARLPGV
jgi:hypothetical protein